MTLTENARPYLESLWGDRLHKLVTKRDSELDRVRRGLMDHSDIFAQRGFENYLQPELDHLNAIGVARIECWLKAFNLDGQQLTMEAIEEALLDAGLQMDSAAEALFARKKNEIKSMRPIPPCFVTQPIPDLLELGSRLTEVQRKTKDELRRKLTIEMYESGGRKAQASASLTTVTQTFNLNGDNARVNVDSIDNSTNVVRRDAPFAEVRNAVEAGTEIIDD